MNFEWDDEKNLINQQKHGVSFEEARGLFESGVDYLEIFDYEHSDFEDSFIAIGPIWARTDHGRLHREREREREREKRTSLESSPHVWPTRTSSPFTARTWINIDD